MTLLAVAAANSEYPLFYTTILQFQIIRGAKGLSRKCVVIASARTTELV